MKNETFIKRLHIKAPADMVFRWHSRPGALERLSPPWDPIQVIERSGGIEKGARVILKMRFGPVPFKWIAEHTDYEKNRLFRDRQVRGPLASWVHTHRFEPTGKQACLLEDRIAYSLRFHPFGDFFAGQEVRNRLERIFNYRHITTAQDIAAHLTGGEIRRKILISGASGVIGSALIPFLTTGGHQVIRLVRNRAGEPGKTAYWDPVAGYLNPNDIRGTDTVIHLAGANIGQGRWTPERKREIIESRRKGTSLLARTIAGLNPRPGTLMCASAIGYYGDRGDSTLTEAEGPGKDFISRVCDEWEKAAAPAIEKGIRGVFLRIGITLTPAGGALAKFLPSFKTGLGAKIGAGNQFMSWIGIDDVIGAIYHAMINETLEGPVNLVSPNPVTNREFTETLGDVLSRPTLLTIPTAAIRLGFGEMGREVLLSSTKVIPEKLLNTGYKFRNPDIKGAFSHLLGKR